ncbi:MAG: PRC-barrel domain-containing protein [Anaerolineae bacterium]
MAISREEIKLDEPVFCSDDEECGRVVSVVIDPIQKSATHIVVRTGHESDERLVPIEAVVSAGDGKTKLSMNRQEVDKSPLFETTHYIKSDRLVLDNQPAVMPFGNIGITGVGTAYSYVWPLTIPIGKKTESYRHEDIPEGQLAIKRGTHIEATDGHVGTVDEFVVDPDNCQITHLVMRKRGGSSNHDIAIPYSAVKVADEKQVFLNLSKAEVKELPAIEVARIWD